MAKLDYSFWGTIDEYSVLQAAFLWLDVEPPNDIDIDEMPQKQEAIADLIEKHTGTQRRHYPMCEHEKLKVSRDELREMAEALEVKPTFLFPDEDTSPKAAVSEVERNTLLKMILGMAVDSYKHEPGAKRSAATGGGPRSIAAALERQQLCVNKDTIKKYLTEAEEKLLSK